MPPTPQKEVVMLRVGRRAGVKQSTPQPRLHTTQPCSGRVVPVWEIPLPLQDERYA